MRIRKIMLGLALFVIVMFCIGLFISRPVVRYAYAGVCINCEFQEGYGWKCVVEEEPGGTFCQAIASLLCEVRGSCLPY